ncbi:MAG: lysylphosphatidylglycerol synthase domain-containing protein [Flaviflexus sp.]|nr:lysylphosphatidylglycerol synthase domain-containing protein [Flaviflexus sp.]
MSRVLRALRSPQVRAGFMLAALAAACWAVAKNWVEVRDAIGRLDVMEVGVSLALSFAFVWATMRAWRVLLNDAGAPISPVPARRIFYVSQVAKYLPGGVWNFVAAAEMGADHQITRRRSVTVLLTSMLVSVVSGLALAVLAFVVGPAGLLGRYWWVLAILPVFAAILHPAILNRLIGAGLSLLRRAGLERPMSAPAIGRAAVWSAGAWLLAGAQVWVILVGLGSPPRVDTYVLVVSAYALAWVVGFLIFFIPAGVGVREVVLGVALAGLISRGDIVVVILLSRLLFTLADLALGLGASAAITRRKEAR